MRGRGVSSCLVALAAIAPSAAATIDGQLFDGAGRAIGGSPVIVLERTGGGLFSRIPETDAELARTSTDARGFFTVDLGPRAIKGRVIVRCHDPGAWDDRRYVRPDDRDVTRALREGGRAIVACRLDDAPGWNELQREIARVGGPESDRGRILRQFGMPPESTAQSDGQVEWHYPGVAYVFREGRLVDTRRTPAAAAPESATGSGARTGSTETVK